MTGPDAPTPGAPVRPRGLDHLVERTRGRQPWRRVFHAAAGLSIAAVLTFLAPTRTVAAAIAGAVLALQLTLDVARLRFPALNEVFFRTFQHLVSPREARGIASSTWYTLGVLLAVAIFPMDAAVSGILVMALADPAASYLGRRYGRTPLFGGTVEGTLVFGVVCLAILAWRHPTVPALVAAAVLPFVERHSWPIDDNLTVPVATATLVTLLGGLT
ncbi:MAG TPA: hypothetical protein VK849_07590 [Longimicrobiales bacterium]|nr:hypothetical protein [Longimicrobiales bacterium]